MNNLEEHLYCYPEYFSAPVEIIWELTGKCSCRCLYCAGDFPCIYDEDELSADERRSLAKEFIDNKVFTVNLSGGEPFLCDQLYELAEMFIKAGIHTSINTAGFNADDEVLKKLCSLDGIAFIVSIDSNKEEINDRVRGRKGALSTALNLISRIQEYSVGRSLIAVECVISKINLEEIDNMIEFFSTKGILQLRFQQVVISGRAQKNRNDVSLDEGVLLHNLIEEKAQKYYERCQADSSLCPMEIHFVDQSSMIRTGIKRGLNWGGIIGPTGRLKPSGYLDVTTDSYRNYGSFINLWNAGYKNVWKIPDIVERFKDINNIWDICKVKESNLDRMTLTFKR